MYSVSQKPHNWELIKPLCDNPYILQRNRPAQHGESGKDLEGVKSFNSFITEVPII